MNNTTPQCPFCGGDIQPETGICSKCTFDMHAGPAPSTIEHHADYGLILLAIPVVSTLLIWFWVGSMSLLQSPGSTLGLILIATSLGTAAVAAYEASKARLHTNPEIRLYSPTAWFFLITLLWGIGYPLYLYKRKYAGLANRLIPGIIIAVLYLGSWGLMYTSIEVQLAEIRADLEQYDVEMGQLEEEWDSMDW